MQPQQRLRDSAAAFWRSNYVVSPRTNWDGLLAAVTNGMGRTEVLSAALFNLRQVPEESEVNGAYTLTFHPDNSWRLTFLFSGTNGALLDRSLSLDLRPVWSRPHPQFTGTWVTYYVNGQTNYQIQYEAGQYHGELISYYTNGLKHLVRHYNHGIADGLETGYYPHGQINHRGLYEQGAQGGLWIWYNEDGSTSSTTNYPPRQSTPVGDSNRNTASEDQTTFPPAP